MAKQVDTDQNYPQVSFPDLSTVFILQMAVLIGRQLGCPIPADLHTHHTNIIHCLRSKPLGISLQQHNCSLMFKKV
jgi:hypothetical protein